MLSVECWVITRREIELDMMNVIFFPYSEWKWNRKWKWMILSFASFIYTFIWRIGQLMSASYRGINELLISQSKFWIHKIRELHWSDPSRKQEHRLGFARKVWKYFQWKSFLNRCCCAQINDLLWLEKGWILTSPSQSTDLNP